MLPAQRREVLQQRIIHGLCMTPQCVDGPLQIHGVPQHNGRRDEVQAAGAVALLLEAAVPDFSQSIEEHRPGQRIARLALVQSDLNAPAQLHALQPIQDEQRALDAHQLAQGHSLAVLAQVAESAVRDMEKWSVKTCIRQP